MRAVARCPFEAPAEQFQYHSTTKDRRLVADPTASGLWARFYDLKDNSVVLATRDSRRVARYEDIPRERRTGYEWYGSWPKRLLSNFVRGISELPVRIPG